jgi:putative hemolysin
MKNAIFAVLMLALLALAGCAAKQAAWTPAPSEAAGPSAPSEAAGPKTVDTSLGLPNPASVLCERNESGTLEMFEMNGGQAGLCNFPDGSICEEWEYYRGECKKGLCFKQCQNPGTADEGVYDSCNDRLIKPGKC